MNVRSEIALWDTTCHPPLTASHRPVGALKQRNDEATTLPKLRSDHQARSSNVAI